jgi:hypothetical protein
VQDFKLGLSRPRQQQRLEAVIGALLVNIIHADRLERARFHADLAAYADGDVDVKDLGPLEHLALVVALGHDVDTLRGAFFLADFAPHDAAGLAKQLFVRNILVKPMNNAALGPGFMRVTTALPEDNKRFVDALRELLSQA